MSPDLVGFKQCPCGELVEDSVAWLTDGHCVPCHNRRAREAVGQRLVVVNGKQQWVDTKTPAQRERERRKNRAKEIKRRDDAAYKRRRHKAEHARRKAMRKLKALYPEVYAMLLAQEREEMGLPAYTYHRAVASPGAAVAYKTLSA